MAKYLIVAGCICLAFSGYLFKERYNPVRLTIATYNIDQALEKSAALDTPIKKEPVTIQISSINVRLPLIPAKITEKGWETTSQGVSYLASSPIPGYTGNSILYGHNWPSLLGNLPKIKPADIIKVYYKDGSYNEFVVEKTAVIAPDQIGILDATTDKRLTIYTCTGFLDSKRFVAVALMKDPVPSANQ